MPLLATLGNAADQAYGFATYAKDQFFNLVTTLISGSGTNAATNNTIVDSSSNNFTVTSFNNVAQGTFTPFSRAAGSWGAYFGGVGNYCTYAGTPLATTSATFTVESWIYMLATPGGNPSLIGDMSPTGTTNNWSFGPNSANKVVFIWYDGAAKSAVGTTVMALNTWYHIAVSVNANAITMYVNGVAETLTGTTTLTNRSSTTSTTVLGQAQSSAFYFIGYAYNISILSGVAKYSGTFTPQTTPLATNTTDQVFLYNGGNTLRDANTATTAKALTATGTLMRATPISLNPRSNVYATYANGGSMYFDGAGDYLTLPNNAAFSFSTGDFTIETWVYITSTPTAYNAIIDTRGADGFTPYIFGIDVNLKLDMLYGTVAGQRLTSAAAVPINAWTHVAVTRSSGTIRLFINGALDVNTASYSSAMNISAIPAIGAGRTTANANITGYTFFGYMSSLRILKGTAQYTTSFSLPTEPLTAITNTQLLLSGVNAGVYDNSGFANVETAGSAQISNAAIKYGNGSIIFNGSTSYLRLSGPIATGGTLIAPVGNFTVEGWVNPTTVNAQRTIFYINGTSNSYASVRLDHTNTGAVQILVSFNGIGWTINTTTASLLVAGTWTHLAVVRNAGNISVYFNGVSIVSNNSISATTALITGTYNLFGAIFSTTFGQYFNGYMSNLRVTQVARYTANFTPPTGSFPIQG